MSRAGTLPAPGEDEGPMSRRHRKRRSRPARGPAAGVAERGSAPASRPDGNPGRTPGLTPPEPPSYDPPGRAREARGDAAPMTSFGEMLKRERELRGITLREVSEATKISIRYLEALERNEFTYLPGGAFTRGFIRAYAKYIGADEDEMVNAYLLELSLQEEGGPPPPTDPVEELRRHHRQAVDEAARARRRRLLVGLAIAALVLLLVAGGAWWFLGRGDGETQPPPRSETMLP